LIEELRTNERKTNASLLIDELFFEYHFNNAKETNLNAYWGGVNLRGGSIDDAMLLMHDLRSKGIRAHFWI
jgi:hypothetical protein